MTGGMGAGKALGTQGAHWAHSRRRRGAGAQALGRRRGRAGQAAATRAGHAAGARTRHGARLGARGARDMRLRHGCWGLRHGWPWLRHGRAKGHDTAIVRAWACLCAPRCAQLGLVRCFVHSDSVFDPVQLSTIPESLNEHCSL